MIINEKKLLELQQPISQEMFAGTYLKLDRQAFRALRNVYNEANSAARKLMQTPDESELDELIEANKESWKKLSDLLCDVLKNKTKDIELISWLMVSQIYLDPSLDGFKNSVSLLKSLILEHWTEIHPSILDENLKSQDEQAKIKERLEFKTLAFSQMVGTGENDSILFAPLSSSPLVNDVTCFKFQSAEKRGECLILKENLKKFVASNKDNLLALLQTIDDSKNSFNEIYKFLNTECISNQVAAPNFSFLINILEKMMNVIMFLTDLSIEKEPETSEEVVDSNQETTNENTAAVASSGNVGGTEVKIQTTSVVNNSKSFELLAKNNDVTREQIFEELENIARYFKRVEPHSPVSYLIDKAIRWGHMSLPELMTELMSDEDSTKQRIFTVAGLGDADAENENNQTKSSNSSNQDDVSSSIIW